MMILESLFELGIIVHHSFIGEKIGAAFGAEGTLPHLPAVFGRPSKRIILSVEIGRAVGAFVAFDPVDGSLLKHGCLRWRIVDTP